jgi:hypothetical protein
MTLSLCVQFFSEDLLFNWIFTNAPIVATFIALMWFTWWIRGIIKDYHYRFENLESDVKVLKTDMGLVKLDIRRLEDRMFSLEQRMTSLERKVDMLEAKFDRKFDALIAVLTAAKIINPEYHQARSPLQLTDTGTQVLIEMGGKVYVDDNLNDLLFEIEQKNFRSALDVQDYCMVLLWERNRDDAWVQIKDFIFRNPEYKINEQSSKPLDMVRAVSIIGIYLRNRYFEKHPELLVQASE